MKRTIISAVLAAGCLAGTSAIAQETPSERTAPHRQTQDGFVRAMDITGSAVRNQNDEEIGTVDGLLIDSQTGAVRFAIVNASKYVGSDRHQVAIPWGAFQIERSAGAEGKTTLVLDAAKEKLTNAPKYDPEKERELYQSNQSEPVFVYWEVLWLEPKNQSERTKRNDATDNATERDLRRREDNEDNEDNDRTPNVREKTDR